MNKPFLYLFLFAIFISIASKAQMDSLVVNERLPAQDSTWITISGLVKEKGNFSPIPFVHVINQSQKIGTVTDDEGLFRVKMLATDTVTFSFVGYRTYVFSLEGLAESDHYAVQIELSQETFELNPLTIYPFPTEEEFKKQILETKVVEKEKKMEGVKYGDGKKKSAVAYASPISALTSLFSKERKLRKRLEKAKENYRDYELIHAKFNEEIVGNLTGLKSEKDIMAFMRFCNFTDDYLLSTMAYDILVAMEYKKALFFDQHPEKNPDKKPASNAEEMKN